MRIRLRSADRRVFRRAREARRRDAVPRERDPGPRHPARTAARSRRALLPFRREQPDQRPEPRAHRRAATSWPKRHRLPIYWGNRNWHPMLADTLRADAGRRHLARAAGVRHLGLRLLLGLPPVSGGHRASPHGGRRRRARDRTKLPRLLRPPGIRRSRRRRVQPPSRSSAATPHVAFTAHSVPKFMADTSPYVAQLARRADGRAELDYSPTGSWSTRAAAARPRSRGWNPTSSTTSANLHAQGVRDVVIAPDRLHLRSHGSPLRPRHGSRRSVQRARDAHGARAHRRHTPGLRSHDPRTLGTQRRCGLDCCPKPAFGRPAATTAPPGS